MRMPSDLFLVRHGLSEANVVQKADKAGSPITLTDDMVNAPDRSWRLTEKGEQQAQAIGEWLKTNTTHIDRFITSPYTRTRETAAHLDIDYAQWEENRSVRERYWGDIHPLPQAEFADTYPHNYLIKKIDPLYWVPPGGESLVSVAENRTRNVLEMLARENSNETVLITTHGEFIWSCRLILERWSDEEFVKNDNDPDFKVHNCLAVHYTSTNPVTLEKGTDLKWVRTAYPAYDEERGEWIIVESPFVEFNRSYYSNKELLNKVHKLERFF